MGNQLTGRAWSRTSQAGDDALLQHRDDILFEILLRVPAEPLCRLRLVCQSWRSLLAEPHFIAAHAARHRPARLLAVASRGVFEEETELKLLDAAGRVVVRRVTTSRDFGPWCSHQREPQTRAHDCLVCVVGADQRLRVIDAATAGAVTVLPDHRGVTDYTCFVLGRTTSSSTGGGQGGEYKVLGIGKDVSTHQFCKVITLGCGQEWREAQSPPTIVHATSTWKSAVANGVVYVLAATSFHWIASFDLDTERWRHCLIRGPPALVDHGNVVCSLIELDGRLVFLSGSVFHDTSVHLFLFMDSGDGSDEQQAPWHRLCTVPTSRIYTRGREVACQLLWVLNGGRVMFVVWSGVDTRGKNHYQPWVLRVYDPRTEACEDVARLFDPADVGVGVCTRNLLCP